MIPKILHQIWIGPNKMPEHLKYYCSKTRKIFYDYDYKFWDNSNMPEMPENCILQIDRYNKLNKYAFSADILRYFVLNKYGGIYLDVDFMCNRRFDHLLSKDFFCVNPQKKSFHVTNAVFACVPNNPILIKLINELKDEKYHGPLLFTKYISDYLKVNYGTNIYKYLENHPNEYISCGKCQDFYQKNGYCFHDALKSWVDK